MLFRRNLPAGRYRRRLLAALTALLIGLLGAACGTVVATPKPARLTLAASSSAQPFAREVASAYRSASPHTTVAILPVVNEAAAVQALRAGQADAALVTGTAPALPGLAASHVASDALAIAVHASRSLDNLDSEQAREIFSGRLRTWDELDAADGDAVVQVLTREQGAGPRQTLVEGLLGSHPLALTAIVLPDDGHLLARLASDPNAIAALPASWLDDQVRAVTLDGRGPEWVARRWPGYPLELPIYLLTNDAPPSDVAALRAFLLGTRGQRMVSQHYAPAITAP